MDGQIILTYTNSKVSPEVEIRGEVPYKAWRHIPRELMSARRRLEAERRIQKRKELEEKQRQERISKPEVQEETPVEELTTETVSVTSDGHINFDLTGGGQGPHNPVAGIAPEEKKETEEATLTINEELEDAEANAGKIGRAHV